ncbi:signal transduction histidine kinase/PAS domain-containing protein [Actinoplanes abujensis]|uniref:histidine kinase n=2 Tax=Paractinoplanes abujensis TaxID=882441 RepID=A0A7W7CKM0_9ACTN|nr:ATP-binding protein [Actinoplanes abujensis]MBB4690212.1 signal transduction histidine kinase/PAS domain-containing protein [Actinoplanes abujensis]
MVDETVLADPDRLGAVRTAKHALPALPLAPDALARLAARLLEAPEAQLTLVDREGVLLAGGQGPPDADIARWAVSAGEAVQRADPPSFLAVPVLDGAGLPVGALAVLDPAARRWTGENARILTELTALASPGASASFLASLIDNLPVGVIACDADGDIAVVNRPVRELIGLPADAAPRLYPTRATGALFDAGGRAVPWRESPIQRAARGERVDTDLVVRVAGRRERIITATAQPILDDDGRRLGAVAVAREVTALRRAERFRDCHRAVEEALNVAGSAAEAAPGVLAALGTTLGWPAAELWLADEDSGELSVGGRWCAPGRGLEEVLTFTPIKGSGITGRVWATGRPIWVPDIADSASLRTPLERRRAAACLRAGLRTVLAVPVRDADTVLGVLTCYGDAPEPHEDLLALLLDGVAARIGVYVALRRAEALARQLSRAKDDFIALVSHEMRTPLTSIVASASMLGDEQSGLDEESRAMVDAVHRNATSLRAVVDTLLDLAGLDSGHVALRTEEVDLAQIVDAALTAARPHAVANGVRLRHERDEPLPMVGDPHRLRQVVDDLLANAIKYSPRGGDVEIELVERAGMAELTVADHGIGTPAEERDRVFDRFYRASNVRHQGIAGKGLGLSLARAIVDLHGGTIRLSGHPPHGTTVLIRLPISPRP